MTRVELTGHLVEDEEGKLYIADKPLASAEERYERMLAWVQRALGKEPVDA